jgi:hypothetical protein
VTAADCAAILHFVRQVEPIDPPNWRDDPEHGPSRVAGFNTILGVVTDALAAVRFSDQPPDARETSQRGTTLTVNLRRQLV